MTRKQKRMLVTEFMVRIYADGRIEWDGLDSFLLWKLNHKHQEGFLPYARKIQGFQNETKKQ